MRIASIDVGSNTVLLLIAEINEKYEINYIKNFYRVPRISKNINKHRIIDEKSIERLLNVLSEYKQIIESYECDNILIKATAAMRIAQNGEEIIKIVSDKLGFDIEIIDGELEAYYSYLGAISTFEKKDNYIVLDIGGASTEIIYGGPEKISFKKSFPFGAVSLTEKYLSSFPYNSSEIEKLVDEIKFNFSSVNLQYSDLYFPIAVAGTPTSLVAIEKNLSDYNENDIDGACLTSEIINNFSVEFNLSSPASLIEKYPKFLEGREDVIYAGTLILKSFSEIFDYRNIYVSGRGLRYGIIIDYVNKMIKNMA